MKRLTAREALSYGMFGDTAKLQDALKGNGSLASANRSLPDARLQLRDAIGNDVVTALGYRANPYQPSLTPEKLDSGLFKRIKVLAVDHTDDTIILPPAPRQNIPRWEHITFDEKEIHDLWPKTNAIVGAWMANDFELNPIKKRDARLGDCKKANGCTVRVAKAAYDKIAPDKKLRRGQKLPSTAK